MEMENIIGLLNNILMDNRRIINQMEKESFILKMDRFIKEIGKIIKKMGLVN